MNSFEEWKEEIIKKMNADKVEFHLTKDNTTFVIDTVTKETAYAKYNPKDTFDKALGRSIAYCRLRNIDIQEPSEELERWKYDRYGKYYFIDDDFNADWNMDYKSGTDDARYNDNNYFYSKKQPKTFRRKSNYFYS